MAYGGDFIAKALTQLIKAIKGGTLGTGSVTTSTSGTTFVQLLPITIGCDSVTFVNNTGTTLSIKVKSSTAYIPLLDGSYFTFDGINSISDLWIKRTDESNTPVTITFIYNS